MMTSHQITLVMEFHWTPGMAPEIITGRHYEVGPLVLAGHVAFHASLEIQVGRYLADVSGSAY